jgi:hypothetical protein
VILVSVRRSFSDQEDQDLLAAFWEFERKLIYEKCKSAVEALASSEDLWLD